MGNNFFVSACVAMSFESPPWGRFFYMISFSYEELIHCMKNITKQSMKNQKLSSTVWFASKIPAAGTVRMLGAKFHSFKIFSIAL